MKDEIINNGQRNRVETISQRKRRNKIEREMIENDSLKKIETASIEETRSHRREIREYSNERSQDDIE